MIETIITTALPIILTSLALYAVAKYFPAKKSRCQTTKSIKELKKEFFKFDLLIYVLFFIITPITTFVLYELFGWFSDIRFSSFQNGGFLCIPPRLIWTIPAFFLSIGIFGFVQQKLIEFILKKRMDEYIAYANLKFGYDAEKSNRFFYKFTLLLVGLFSLFFINKYSYFGKDQIVVSDFFQLTKSTYKYSDITSMKAIEKAIAPNGNIVISKHYIIDFLESEKWNSKYSGEVENGTMIDMIQFISQSADLELQCLEFDSAH